MNNTLKKCNICNGIYPPDKHNFEECKSVDSKWDNSLMEHKCTPCIKWVGGKQQLKHTLRKHFINDKSFDTYYEPFLGGGSVLLLVLDMIEKKEIDIKNIIASDINWQLICMYNCIKNNPIELINDIDELYQHYKDAKIIEYKKRHKCVITTLEDSISKGKKYVYYYFREQYNKLTTPSIRVASLFIILNKLCFRGLYRSGRNGFNTPYGNYINPSMYNIINIIKMYDLFNVHNVCFKNQPYTSITVKDSDIIYMDPPYYPIKKKSFEAYSIHKFNHIEFVSFAKSCENFIQSNSWCKFNVDSYRGHKLIKILCKRRINSKKPQDKDFEVIILSNSLHSK